MSSDSVTRPTPYGLPLTERQHSEERQRNSLIPWQPIRTGREEGVSAQCMNEMNAVQSMVGTSYHRPCRKSSGCK
jgi:hypothetical protein